ncbi:MAG: CHAT domain-containing protein [Scytonema hyalinum WJT4-NPBG1]|jgi:CHAT domain-containing protein|nr:CHAT domain-containing protein [Scytonema hyalinum WJT4-NPBG1]
MPSKHQISSVRRSLKLILLCSLSSILWLNHTPLSPWRWGVGDVVTAETRDASQLVQQIQESKQAIAYYRQTKNWLQVGQMLTQQAQAYKNLGQPIAAIALLDSALQIARAYNNSVLEASVLGSRGEAYQQKGDYKQAITDLQDSLKIANKIKNSVYRASALKNLGNTYISLAQVNYLRANSAMELGDDEDADILREQGFNYDYKALDYLHKSIVIARQHNNKLGEIRLLINSILPANRTKKSNLVKAKLQEALVLLKQLPNSQDKVYVTIELAKFVQPLDDNVSLSLVKCPQPIVETGYIASRQLLQQAVLIAQRLPDNRALSFALGHLAHLSECRHNYEQALKLTREAESVAEKVNAKDSLYLWKWQVARILKAQNKPLKAITAYKAAINALKLLRSRHVIFDSNVQEPEQDYFERIYREFIELKLTLVDAASQNNNNSKLSNILTNLEALKLAELQNYFGKSLLTPVHRKRVEADTDKTTAVFYSIMLEKRIAIIALLPNSEKHLKWIYIDRKSLRQQINEFRRSLERRSDIIYNPQEAQNLYDSIVRPFAKDLDSLHVKTLVFINDGILRTVPMAALHDGEGFLVQRYAIATTNSLTLINTKKVNHENLRVLAVGLTKNAVVDGRTYEALTNVRQEINQVVAQIPDSKQLLDENFTYARLQAELSQTAYSIIHIATHGTFGTVPEDSFLVTGNNDKLTLTDLDNMIGTVARSSKLVDLLVLTACESAMGDNRVGLGLAGVVVNAGVKSVLASLWSINDAATVTLVKKFYAEWYQNKVSKAEALRRAQQTLISSRKYAHPYYWAPFILVGNWL